jgi:hypothetical protein
VGAPQATPALVVAVVLLSLGTTRGICVAGAYVISGTTFVHRLHISRKIFGRPMIFELLLELGTSAKCSRSTETIRAIVRFLAKHLVKRS